MSVAPLHPRSDDSRQRLWEEPRAADLVELIALPAARYPDLAAVHLCHHGPEPETVTWGGLWEAACREAARLRREGVAPGDRVVLVLSTSREFLAAFFGAVLAGALPVPAAPPHSLRGGALEAHAELLLSIVRDSGARACLSLPRTLAALGPALAAEPGLRLLPCPEAGPAAGPVEIPRPGPAATAFLQYTSGSTSRPKGVLLSHRSVLANAEGIAQRIVSPGTVGLSWLPLHHDMGLIGTLLTGLYARVPVVLMPPQAFIKDPARWLLAVSEYGATLTVAPNFAFDYCVRNVQPGDLAGARLDTLETALNGAEPIDAETVAEFESRFRPFGLRAGIVRPVYGLAESALAVTFSEPGRLRTDRVDAARLESEGRAAPVRPGARSLSLVSVGRPIPGQRVRIADARGRLLPERQVGEVQVSGPSVMSGYHNRPAESAAALRDGWLCTGDLGYLAGGELFLTGRSKDLIIRQGRNYHPQDIEHAAGRVEGVRREGVAAFGVEDPLGTSVVVVAETRLRDAGDLAQAERRMRERVHDALLLPLAEVLLVPRGTLPRTTSGKLRRQECRRLYLAGELGRTQRGAAAPPPAAQAENGPAAP
ncbi:MAG: fatty acyl-AMP ligase [Acidobacteriota bacterium]